MSFSDDLLKWYDRNRRSLPWRDTHDPYRIWLSEIMLQQTQVETVKVYYSRFLERFPSVSDLAHASEEEVLKLWEGLGYYSRARNLHRAARYIAFEADGCFPGTPRELQRLPGVGPYAANAIASIAFGIPVPALDGNQARVLSRILVWTKELRTPFDLIEPSLQLISKERPGDYNQALMDLGAGICTPRQPKCEECPLRHHCLACAAGNAEAFPVKPAAAQKKQQDLTILLLETPDGLLVRRRPKGLLGGLYEFFNVDGHHKPDELIALLSCLGFSDLRIVRRLPDVMHAFTHLVWHMEGWHLLVNGRPGEYNAVAPSSLERLPFPGALKIYRREAERLSVNQAK